MYIFVVICQLIEKNIYFYSNKTETENFSGIKKLNPTTEKFNIIFPLIIDQLIRMDIHYHQMKSF